jgi:UDP-2,3-diacylglucosamine hydrolase
MMRTLLIADLHLTSGEADKTNLFIKFCHKKAIEADQIFILGDLFDTTQLVCLANSSPNKKSRLPPMIKTWVVLLSFLSAEITLG